MAGISNRPFLQAGFATGGTITPPAFAGVPPVQQDTVLLQPAAPCTGAIIAAGSVDGQELKVVNDSANSITFAASGTSNVADGTGDVIAADRGAYFKWVQLVSLWFRLS